MRTVTVFTTYHVAPHAAVVCSGERPPWITTQSAELYRRLTFYRVRVHLQAMRAAYPQSGYYDLPRVQLTAV